MVVSLFLCTFATEISNSADDNSIKKEKTMTINQRRDYKKQLFEVLAKFPQNLVYLYGVEVKLPTSRGLMQCVKIVDGVPRFAYYQLGQAYCYKWYTFDVTTIRQVINKLNDMLSAKTMM